MIAARSSLAMIEEYLDHLSSLTDEAREQLKLLAWAQLGGIRRKVVFVPAEDAG